MTFLPVPPDYPDERDVPKRVKLRYQMVLDKHVVTADGFPDFRLEGLWFGPLMETLDQAFSSFMSAHLGCHITYLADLTARPVTILKPTLWLHRGWPPRKTVEATDHLWTSG